MKINEIYSTSKCQKLNEKNSQVVTVAFTSDKMRTFRNVAVNIEHAFTVFDPKVSAYDAQRLDDLQVKIKSRHFICSCRLSVAVVVVVFFVIPHYCFDWVLIK